MSMKLKKFCLKKGYGSHYYRNPETGKTERLFPGDFAYAYSAEEFGGAQDKFEEVPARRRTPPVKSKPETEGKTGRQRRVKPDEDNAPDEDNVPDEIPEELELKMEHRGGGRYQVFNVLTDKPIHDGFLTKEQAKDLIEEKE